MFGSSSPTQSLPSSSLRYSLSKSPSHSFSHSQIFYKLSFSHPPPLSVSSECLKSTKCERSCDAFFPPTSCLSAGLTAALLDPSVKWLPHQPRDKDLHITWGKLLLPPSFLLLSALRSTSSSLGQRWEDKDGGPFLNFLRLCCANVRREGDRGQGLASSPPEPSWNQLQVYWCFSSSHKILSAITGFWKMMIPTWRHIYSHMGLIITSYM